MLVAHKNALTRPSHAMLDVMLLQSFQSGNHRRVLLWLCFLGTERVIGERVETDGFWLIGREGFGECRALGPESVS